MKISIIFCPYPQTQSRCVYKCLILETPSGSIKNAAWQTEMHSPKPPTTTDLTW